jgi:hypothetical protein
VTWSSLFEGVLIAGGLAYLLWRRNRVDRLLMGMLACILVGSALLDTQGYFDQFNVFYIIPVGPLLVDGLQSAGVPHGQNRHSVWVAGCVMVLMAAQITAVFIDWDTFQTWTQTSDLPPFFYEELGKVLNPLITEDDVLAGSDQFLWSLPEHPHIYTTGAEAVVLRERPDIGATTPLEVWEYIAPTVVVYVEHEMTLTPGLEAYMDIHDFEVCERFALLEHTVEVYRADCP